MAELVDRGQRAALQSRSPWSRQWGLRFESSSDNIEEQERSFLAARGAAHRSTATVLSAGVALVHGLLAFKLFSQGQSSLAATAAVTMAQQLLVWVLAVLWPRLFWGLRPLLYTFSVTLPVVQASPLWASGSSSSSTGVVSCGASSSPALWLSQLLSSGVPWLVVHALLFPLTVNEGLLVHGLAVTLLLSNNRRRCLSAMQQCPAAKPVLQWLAAGLQRLTVFSVSCRSWLDGTTHFAAAAGGSSLLGPAGSTSNATSGQGSSSGSGVVSEADVRACMAVYGSLQIAVGYLAVLQLAWSLERAARLAFLRRTDEVEAEWRLERKQRQPGTLMLELGALLLLAWQCLDLWMSTAADWGTAGGSAALRSAAWKEL